MAHCYANNSSAPARHGSRWRVWFKKRCYMSFVFLVALTTGFKTERGSRSNESIVCTMNEMSACADQRRVGKHSGAAMARLTSRCRSCLGREPTGYMTLTQDSAYRAVHRVRHTAAAVVSPGFGQQQQPAGATATMSRGLVHEISLLCKRQRHWCALY